MDFSSLLNNPTYLIIGIVAIVGIIVAYFVWTSYSSGTKYDSNREHEETNPDSNKVANLMLFYADWCPHCKTAKPEWNALKDEYDGKTINGYVVVFEEHNCSETTAEVEENMDKYDVSGYPTVKLIKDGQLIDCNSKITKANMEKFLTTVL